jgi:hypothetical protein
MAWKCYLGQPFEFNAKYEGILVKKDGGPDTSPIYGLKMTNFNWLKPNKIHIGKGFYVQPDLPHGITHYGPEASYDLELIVTGPGLPTTGQRVSFQWGLSPCFPYPGTANTKCKQFMGMEVVKSKSGPSTFTIEFVSGYTEQQYIKGWNLATWRICYDGPFETVMLAPLPNKWELGRVPLWIELLTSKIEECGYAAGCEFNVQPPMDAIDGAITNLIELPVPEDQKRLSYEIIASLEQNKAELSEADSLLSRSGEVTSEKERWELRAGAISHLEKALELNRQAMELLSQLQGVLKGKGRGSDEVSHGG